MFQTNMMPPSPGSKCEKCEVFFVHNKMSGLDDVAGVEK
jgi:hypothetical protein